MKCSASCLFNTGSWLKHDFVLKNIIIKTTENPSQSSHSPSGCGFRFSSVETGTVTPCSSLCSALICSYCSPHLIGCPRPPFFFLLKTTSLNTLSPAAGHKSLLFTSAWPTCTLTCLENKPAVQNTQTLHRWNKSQFPLRHFLHLAVM